MEPHGEARGFNGKISGKTRWNRYNKHKARRQWLVHPGPQGAWSMMFFRAWGRVLWARGRQHRRRTPLTSNNPPTRLPPTTTTTTNSLSHSLPPFLPPTWSLHEIVAYL